jgi:hypothetical protein
MAEWLKAHAWKACVRETVPWVRIPLSPPTPHSPEFASIHRSPLLTGISFILPYVLARLRSLKFVYHLGVHLGVGMKGNLTALKVTRLRQPGMYPDGGGLFLQVTKNGRSWVYRYMNAGQSREMGLGSAATISLADARKRRDDAKRQRDLGIDPIEQRRNERAKAFLDAARAMTFREAASAYIDTHKAAWRNAKHRAQWTSTLEAYAYPIFGKASVQSVDTTLVLKALEPIWAVKPETASRVRGRVEVILDWAKVRGFREGENPARWRGHLAMILPPRSKVRKVVHHTSLPYREIGAFMADLRARE